MITLEAAAFGVSPDGDNNVLALWLALDACRAQNGAPTTLRFARGTYAFTHSWAMERLCWISNNDGGLRRVAFLIENFANLTIDGGGAEFLFRGEIIPFMVEGSRGVTLQNFTIDYTLPVTLYGSVFSRREDDTVTIDIADECRFKIEADGKLTSQSAGYASEPAVTIAGYIELDRSTRAPAYETSDVWRSGKPDGWEHSFENLGNYRLRFRPPADKMPRPGNHLVFLRGDRRNPGIFLNASEDVRVVDVTVFQATAMALIAQRCTNVTAERFCVTPRPGTERLVSATADATHFVGCRGTIRLLDCHFEGQLDDATNVHGIYAYLYERLAPNTLLMGRNHEQQKGVTFAGPGDQLAFYDAVTMEPVGQGVVARVREINSGAFYVEFTESLPESVDYLYEDGCVAENLSWTPDVVIRGCVARRNRARGFLISTPGNVVIEGCTLSPGGAGILIAGESEDWYESGAVRDVAIRGNHFDNCNTGRWGIAAIDITPHISRLDLRTEPFHRNIRIEGNTFTTFQNALIAAWSVDGLTVRGNRVEKTGDHAPFGAQTEAIALRECRNVDLEDAFAGDDAALEPLLSEHREARQQPDA